jgi:hypothetical protein
MPAGRLRKKSFWVKDKEGKEGAVALRDIESKEKKRFVYYAEKKYSLHLLNSSLFLLAKTLFSLFP